MTSPLNMPDGATFDRDGFFLDPSIWDERLASQIAQNDGLGKLSEAQIQVLLVLRDKYAKHGNVTALSHVCHLTGHDANCMQPLFRSPREAWRLAGLPNPGEEAKAYLSVPEA